MTVKDLAVLISGKALIEVIEDGETAALFEPEYTDSIKDEVLNLNISNIEIKNPYLKAPRIIIETEESAGDEDTEPGEEEPDDDDDN